MKITRSLLKKYHACEEQITIFDQHWPDGVMVTKESLAQAVSLNLDIDWLRVLLGAPAWAEYNKVCAPAWAEYDKVYAPARAEYDKACASAWAEYYKVYINCLAKLFSDL